MAKLRAGVVVAPMLAVLAVLVTGCSSDGGSGDDELTLPSTTPTAEETGEPTDDEATLEELHTAYWSALVELENGDDLDPAVFDGLAASSVVEQHITRIRPIRDSGHTREGEPLIDNITIDLKGDEATIQSCVDTDGWLILKDGEEVTREQQEPGPAVIAAERSADGWLVTAHGTSNGTITC